MDKQTIPFLIEGKRGHDTTNVPVDEVQEKAEEQLKADRNVTLEGKDGETEILTKSDMPDGAKTKTEEQIRQEDKEWAAKFKNTETATSTKKTKGF